jgi:hypothetical protein
MVLVGTETDESIPHDSTMKLYSNMRLKSWDGKMFTEIPTMNRICEARLAHVFQPVTSVRSCLLSELTLGLT